MMIRDRNSLRAFALATCAVAAICSAPAAAQTTEAVAAEAVPPANTAEAALIGDDIIVTARRRGESLQDVPIAVSVFSGEALANKGAVDITALQQQTPNLTLQIARGSNSTLIGFIRGVGQQDPLWGFEPGVGIYLDDVFVARPQGAVLDIFEVERIEVLRGPQGTLYGRNTIGGAVKYVTKRLGDDFRAKVRGAYGSFDQIDLVGSVAVPIGGGLSVGGAVAMFKRDGYGKNLTTGADHYDKDVLAARVSLEYAPSDALFVRLAGDMTDDESNARHGHRELPNGADANSQPLRSKYDTRAGAGDKNNVETRGVSLTAEFKPADQITLKSITAYREGETDGNIDFDNTAARALDIPAQYRDDQFSQELQLLFEGDRIQGVAGVYFYDGTASGAFDTVLGNANLTIFTTGAVKTTSYAAFGDLSFDISDKLKASIGGRYTSDKREGTVFRRNFTGIRSPFFGNAAAVPGLVRSDYTNTRTDKKFTPRVSLSYQPTNDLTVYASYGKGYKSGGFDMRGDVVFTPNTVNGYDPETVDAYEVGVKGAFLDRSLFVNIAAFYADYKDQQVTRQEPTATGIASFVDNAGDSKIYGLEIEARAVLSDNVSATASFGYINADFKRFTTFDLATRQPINIQDRVVFQNTPKFSVSVAPTFQTSLAGGEIAFTPSLSFRSAYSQFELPNPILDQDGYELVDASIVWTSKDDRLQLAAHGRNLFNNRYRIGGYNFPGALFGNSVIGFYGPPRTFTVSAEVRF